MSASLPEITLEINSGSLTIRTAEAVYHILVVGDGHAIAAYPATPVVPALAAPAARPALAAPAELAPAQAQAAKGAPEDEEYYRDLSNEMYNEVGRLARRLSMSIRDVSIDKVDSIDFDAAGDQLESAKDELENVVKMTEQATLKIMDFTEAIQDAVDKSKAVMQEMLAGNEASAPDAEVPETTEDSEAAPDLGPLTSFLDNLKHDPLADCVALANQLLEAIKSALAASAAAPAAAPALAGPQYDFPLDLVFQTMYELCTNEAVKKHVKAMWDTASQTFNQAQLEAGLNAVAIDSGGPDEDNFLNLNLKDVLKAMFQATVKENFQQILKKMASTADQIFLEPSLPLEAMPKAAGEAAPEAPATAPAPEGGGNEELLAVAQNLLTTLQSKAASLTPPELPDLSTLGGKTVAGVGAGANYVSPELVEKLQSGVSEIFNNVNGIVEALSFQDLSGQTIYKTVKLLTDFQVQLLAMVVGFGSKIKTKAEAPEHQISTAQSEAMAQEEVDKALAAVGAKESDEEGASKLNQNSVNDLLGSLGF